LKSYLEEHGLTLSDIRDYALKGLSQTDVFAFGEYVFGHEAASHHREMVEFILDSIARGESCVVLEPRGHAKTTWGNSILLSWLIAKNKNLRVGLISNTAKQANDFSRAIRWNMESNERFREVFGDLTSGSAKMTDVEWLLRDSVMNGTKDVTMYSAGAGGAIISKRFDLIVCDDIIDEENYANIEQSEKIDTWFWKTLRPCLVPGGVVVMLGTRWAEGDLYEQLITPTTLGGKGWRHLRRGAVFDQDGERKALWPQVWSLNQLDIEKENMGSAMFACSYLNDISGLMEGNVFRKEHMRYFDDLPEGRRYTVRMGVDLASSEKERADYTARVTTAEDEEGNFYVLSVVRSKMETGHAAFIRDGWEAYPNLSMVICENQQFQSTLIQEVMRTYSYIPIEGKKTDVDKTSRARAVAAKYEAHKVFHRRSMAGTDFETELLSFPKGHDDMVDALGFSMDLGSRKGLVFGALAR
jgi:predicted phage terminase large subunit-like protein